LDESESFVLLFAHKLETLCEVCFLLLEVVPKKNIDESQSETEVLFATQT